MKKKINILLLVALLSLTLFGCDGNEKPIEESIDTSQVEEVDPIEEDSEVVQEEQSGITWDDLKDEDNIVGKSDKDFKELTKSKPTDVRNDTTGKWKKSTVSENVNLEEYLLSYVDLYMEDGDVHFIINFNYNTTTRVNYNGGLINASVMEYERKEEHDAKTIGSGMLLKSYAIYPDGDIEEVGD